MKRVVVLLLFGLFIFRFAHPVVAQTPIASPSANATMGATLNTLTDYNLAYPGLLPGHPLYFLKALRDRVIGLLISDPQKKAEFYLLASDKRLYAGVLLVQNEGKDELAVSTISKSNNYFHQVLGAVGKVPKNNPNRAPFLEKAEVSIKKHQEMAEGLLQELERADQQALRSELNRMQDFEKQVQALRKANSR